MVLLSTSDNKEFIVDREVAERMPLINGSELEISIVSSHRPKVLEYCEHHRGEPVDQDNTTEWDRQFVTQVEPKMLAKITADFLEMKPLLELGTKTISDLLKYKSADEIRELFNIKAPELDAHGCPRGSYLNE
ncbi:hypothetical protein V5O48_008702 [Marasmius crinis-equi]|uniref:SKP1 component dimerisation domain-containing protein n=1 Tax=Marasmius crinis-equi TaxID=585013 RepID=A0ABR3FDB4_9AGAR